MLAVRLQVRAIRRKQSTATFREIGSTLEWHLPTTKRQLSSSRFIDPYLLIFVHLAVTPNRYVYCAYSVDGVWNLRDGNDRKRNQKSKYRPKYSPNIPRGWKLHEKNYDGRGHWTPQSGTTEDNTCTCMKTWYSKTRSLSDWRKKKLATEACGEEGFAGVTPSCVCVRVCVHVCIPRREGAQ